MRAIRAVAHVLRDVVRDGPELLADWWDLSVIDAHAANRMTMGDGEPALCAHILHRPSFPAWPCDDLLDATSRHVDRLERGVVWRP